MFGARMDLRQGYSCCSFAHTHTHTHTHTYTHTHTHTHSYTHTHTLQVGSLEFSQYLEQYLWPAFDATTASIEHVLSIVLMVNEKLREQAPGWETFEAEPEQFPAFFRRVRQACLSKDATVSARVQLEPLSRRACFSPALHCSWTHIVRRRVPTEPHLLAHSALHLSTSKSPLRPHREQITTKEHTFLIVFMVRCIQHLENNLVRDAVVRPITSIGTWKHVLPARRDAVFKRVYKLDKAWRALQRKREKMTEDERADAEEADSFLWDLMGAWLTCVCVCVYVCVCGVRVCVCVRARARAFFVLLVVDNTCHHACRRISCAPRGHPGLWQCKPCRDRVLRALS
jgi:hypothetical protein